MTISLQARTDEDEFFLGDPGLWPKQQFVTCIQFLIIEPIYVLLNVARAGDSSAYPYEVMTKLSFNDT